MEEKTNFYRYCWGNLKRPPGRPRGRWEDNIKICYRNMMGCSGFV
jgi:hypothetical protein